MAFSEDDKALMKKLHLFQCSQRSLAEFPIKNWTKGRLDTLVKKVKETGSTDRT